jgi:cell division protein FtsL
MTRLNLVLLLAVLASALYLVSVQYESRRLFSALDQASSEAHKIETDSERLQVEVRKQATPLEVERLAKEKLKMRAPTPGTTCYLVYAAATPGLETDAARAIPGGELQGQRCKEIAGRSQ